MQRLPLSTGTVLFTIGLAGSSAAALVCPGTSISLATPTTGDTTGGTNTATDYTCAASSYGSGPGPMTGFDGPEDVYDFTVTSDMVVSFQFETSVPGMRLFILSGCSETACLDEGGCGENLAPGAYHLVVDALGGAAGSYRITPIVLPPNLANEWYECPECVGSCGQTAATRASRRFQFNSSNYCGTDCDFSLYAVVGCGTELHIPFFDGETGHMQVYDVLRGRYLDLVATNRVPANGPLPPACQFDDVGTTVAWEDRGCSTIPCPSGSCGGGSDCRTNNLLLDVQLTGEPNLCGVYRLDHVNWGGWLWEVFANCTADRLEQFFIYRDLCSALTEYHPRPEVGIASVWYDDADCGSLRVSGEAKLENVGCVESGTIELVIEQAFPLPPNPKVFVVNVVPGVPATVVWDYDLTSAPARLVFTIDPDSKVAECSDGSGTAVSCGSAATLTRTVEVDTCALKCATFPTPGDLKHGCLGSGCLLDAGGSEFRCKSSGAPEYRWEDAVGTALPGCDWGPSPVCNLTAEQLPPGKSHFTLRTRCGASTECLAGATTAVIVGRNEAPSGVGNQLRSVRVGSDLELSWVDAGCSSTASLKVYRDAVPDVPAVSRTPVGEVALGVGRITDRGAVDDPAWPRLYYQLIGLSCQGDIEGPY